MSTNTHCWPIPFIEYKSLSEITEPREVALFVSPGTWDAVAANLNLTVASRHEVTEATLAHWGQLAADATGEVVYAIGGGLAVDAAKWVAHNQNLPLVCIPTAISVDAFLTWASGYRGDGCVRYSETKPPEHVIIDFDVITAGPKTIKVAGISDVLSIATGRWDWKYAHDHNDNPPEAPYDSAVDEMARTILDAALDCAEAAGRDDHAGIRRIVECLAMEVQLCNLIGHSRPEEGSEHYFAYAAEERLGKGLPHGDLVGPGIVIMAALQGQDPAPLAEALRACHVPLDKIGDDDIRAILRVLPEYCITHKLPRGIAHDLDASTIKNLDLSILK